jgi:hypothetical protein
MMPTVHHFFQLQPIRRNHKAWRELLRRWGWASEILAEHVHADLYGSVHRLDRRTRQLLDIAELQGGSR